MSAMDDKDEFGARMKAHRPMGPVERSRVTMVDMPPFNKVANREAVIFAGAEPSS